MGMAAMELDPLFVKALKLLHSKSKEFTDQLRDMLNEVLNKRKSRLDLKDDDRKHFSKSPSQSSGSSKSSKDGSVKKEGEKRHLDKVKQEPDLFAPDPKKIKIEPTGRSRS